MTQQLSQRVAPPNVRLTPRDLLFFNLLRKQTVNQVAGGFDHDFWSVDVLRATHHYPAIWHASLALAAMHERMRILDNTTVARTMRREHYTFALKQYNLAIQEIIAITNQPVLNAADQETLLLASALFAGLCCAQGDINQAIKHAINALEFCQQWQFWDQARHISGERRACILRVDSLVTLMSHFELQFINRLKGVSTPQSSQSKGMAPKCFRTPFSSATDAYYEFQPLLTSLIGLWSHTELKPVTLRHSPATEMRYAHRIEFDNWRRKFDDFVHSERCTEEDSEGVLILRLLLVGAKVALEADFQQGEIVFDQYRSTFEQVVSLAEELVNLHASRAEGWDWKYPLFSYSIFICESLLWVGTGCRDPTIRRRIIDVLQKWPHRDGIWDSRLIAAIVETTMRLEESGWSQNKEDQCECMLGAFICNNHRVVGHEVAFLKDGEAEVTIKTVGDWKHGRPGTTVMLCWLNGTSVDLVPCGKLTS